MPRWSCPAIAWVTISMVASALADAQKLCTGGCPTSFDPVCTSSGYTAANDCVARCGGATVASRGPCPGEALWDDGNPNIVGSAAEQDDGSSPDPDLVWSKDVIERHRSQGYRYMGQLLLLSYSQLRLPRSQQDTVTADPGEPHPSAPGQRTWLEWISGTLGIGTGAGSAQTEPQGKAQEPAVPTEATKSAARQPLPPEVARLARTPQAPQTLTVLRVTSDGFVYVRTLPPTRSSPRYKPKSTSGQSSTPTPRSLRSDEATPSSVIRPDVPEHVARMLLAHLSAKHTQGLELSALERDSLTWLTGSDTGPAQPDLNGLLSSVHNTADEIPLSDTRLTESKTCPSEEPPWLSSSETVRARVESEEQWARRHIERGQARRRLGVFKPDHRIDCPRFPTYPYTAVGQINFDDGSKSFLCSGTMIGPDVMLTAAHCVYDRQNRVFYKDLLFSPMRFVPSDGSAPVSPFGTLSWTHVDVLSNYVNDLASDPNQFDMAVVHLSAPIGYKTGWMGLSPACGLNWQQAFPATTAGYPTDVSYGACITTQCSIQQDQCFAPLLFHYCDTITGQSGSAIWQSEPGPDLTWAAYIRAVHNVEWQLGNGTVYINSGVAITPTYEAMLLSWISDSFSRIASSPEAPQAARGLQPGDPFRGQGLGHAQLLKLAESSL